jgi:hypothetical protein
VTERYGVRAVGVDMVGLTLFMRMRWYSDCWRERRSVPGERRLCSRRVNRRATLRRARSGEPSVGNAVTVMIGVKCEDGST